VGQADIVNQETDGFLNRVFKGDVKALLANFVENKKLSQSELDYLKQLLEEENR